MKGKSFDTDDTKLSPRPLCGGAEEKSTDLVNSHAFWSFLVHVDDLSEINLGAGIEMIRFEKFVTTIAVGLALQACQPLADGFSVQDIENILVGCDRDENCYVLIGDAPEAVISNRPTNFDIIRRSCLANDIEIRVVEEIRGENSAFLFAKCVKNGEILANITSWYFYSGRYDITVAPCNVNDCREFYRPI